MSIDIFLPKVVNFCLKLKNLFYKLPTILLIVLTCFGTRIAVSQNQAEISVDSTSVLGSDSASIEPKEQKRDIQTTINYNARDSIRFNVVEQRVYLYGDAWVDYGDTKLDAEIIFIDWQTGVITATYLLDDSTGKKIGVPHFQDGDDEYEAEKIIYNYKTGKGYISEIVTSDGEGYLVGKNANKDADNNLLIDGAMYTTCNRKEPHYHFKLRKTKVVEQRKIVTNYFNLYIDEVPTPLGLPFGLFPMAETKSSGVIIPTWGEAASRGFFLRDGGYYWAVNDYIGAKFLGEIYANGGWGATADVDYKKRYSYKGGLMYSYRDIVRNGDQYDRTSSRDYQFRWTHTPESRGGKSFSANVNYASSSFYSNTTTNVNTYLASSLNSTVRYYTPIKKTPFNVSANLRHDQNNQTGVVNMNLPDINLSMNRVNPFKTDKVGFKSSFRKFYEGINLQYAFDMRNKLTNAPTSSRFPFTVSNIETPDTVLFNAENFNYIWRNKETGMKHDIPVSGSMKVGPFSLNGNFNYSEYWYPKSYNYNNYTTADSGVVVNEVSSFDRAYGYNGGVSVNTTMYGMYSFIGKRNKQIRHTVRPNVGWRMSPDYTKNSRIFKTIQTDSLGNEVLISKFNGLTYAAPNTTQSSSITFGIQNVFEMKYKAIKDSAQESKKIKLLENLSINSSYNFAADSFQLSKFNISANTNLFNLLNVNFSSVVDPYAYVVDSSISNYQRRSSTLAWDAGKGVGQTESWSLALSTNLNPDAFKKRYKNQSELPAHVRNMLEFDPSMYVDFNIPWSLSVSYTYRESHIGFLTPEATQSLQFNGDVKLTQTWKVGYGAAYDFEDKRIVTPRLNIYKDLHCWEMRFQWVPYGPATMYEFYINVKASVLQDLKWSRRRSYYDR